MKRVLILLGLTLSIGIASAQTFGEITGEVKDQSGAVVPGVPVTVTNTGTNASRTSTANDAGVYSFPSLVPGTYQVKVEAPGFQPMLRTNIELEVQQTARIDFTLSVGQSTQTIEVAASAQLLTTESATVGTVITEKNISDLPLNGRNFLQLIALAPNVSYGFLAPAQAANRQGGDRANQNYSVAGMRGTFNNYTMDGVSNLDPNFNLYIQIPSIDALQEFKVQSGIYPAEFGREAAQINVSTKSGTNSFHGSAFEFLRNDALDAKPFDFIGTSPPKNPYRQNQYGYFLSGPVWIPKLFNGKNKVFFMSNWEGYKSRLTNENLYTVPPETWRNGDFSQFKTVLLDPRTRVKGDNGQYTALPFETNNVIPASLMDKTSQALYQFLPLPNINPLNSTNPNNNLQIPDKITVDKNQVTERLDYTQNANSQWFGRFGWTSENTITPTFPKTGGTLNTNSKQYMVSNTWVLSPSKVNEVRFGYTSIFNAVADFLANKQDVVSDLGLPFPKENAQSWGIPNVSLATNGLSAFGDNTNGPFVIDDKILQILDNFSWNHGKHSIRFGGEYRHDIFNQFGNQYTRSQLQFNGQYTANPQTLAGGNAAADFFMGSPYRVDLALTLATANDTANSLAFYVDDTYKMTPKLTISVGLRWELVQPWLDTNQNMVNFQFKTGLPNAANVDPSLYPVYVRPGSGDFYQGLDFRYVNLTGIGQAGPIPVARDGRLGDRLVNTDWRNFAPRFGIAYSPTSQWSIRTGFGIFYSQETGNSKFDLNRGTSGRLTDLPGTQTAPTLTYGNSYSTAILPVPLNPGLTWAVDQNIHTPTSMMYLLDVQRQLGGSTTLEAVYQGVLHRHLQNQYNADGGVPGIAAAQTRVPYPMFSSGIELTEGWGTGNYNGLSTKLSQRFKAGLTTLVSFTWARAMDNGSAIRGTTGDQYPQDPRCVLHCGEYGPSGFNTPLRFVTSLLYELPFGQGKSYLNRGGFSNALVGGWQLTTIFTAQSGRALNTVSWDAAGQIIQPSSNRLNSTGISPYATNPTANGWFNLAAFSNPVAGTFGNIQRNSLIGPSTWEADFSTFKNFHFTERQTLQFRMEAFNVLNHVALNSPNMAWGTSTQTPAATFGLIRDNGSTLGTAYAMRQIQFALKYIF